jgi:flagellar basal-body rod protein FlgC
MFGTLDISSSALTAQRIRMDSIAQNVANQQTTHNAQGQAEPYKRRFVVFGAGRPDNPQAPGVHAEVQQQAAFRPEYDPGHRDADADGYVKYPDIDLAVEMVNAIEASRAYEANVTTMEVTKAMINASLRLLA